MFRKLGLAEILEVADSWPLLRSLIIHFNDPDEGNFVKAVRRCDGVAISGERALLHAICYATDFACAPRGLFGNSGWITFHSKSVRS